MKIPLTGLELRLFRGGTREVQIMQPLQTGTKVIAYAFEKDSWLGRINWPLLKTDDPWAKISYSRKIKEFMDYYNRNTIDFCTLKDLKELVYSKEFKSSEPRDVVEKLRLVHCVDFKTLPTEIVEEIPDLINQYLGTAQLEREARGEDAQSPFFFTKALLDKKG